MTGGIASGKTAVSDRLAELGAAIVDTDQIARDVVQPGESGLNAIVTEFGPSILDAQGQLDRKKLRAIVFADPSARERLEQQLHPLIRERARQAIRQHANAPYVVLVVPLLVESGLFRDADQVVVVDVPETTQIQRLIQRDGIDQSLAQSMLDAQASRAQRRSIADHIIDNTGSLNELYQQLDRLHQSLLQAHETPTPDTD